MFKDVKRMNLAFGNPEGDYDNLNWERLMKQVKNIPDEYKELMKAFEKHDPIKTRDALCDIVVFALGAFHLMGANADDDMLEVFLSNMSKFCKTPQELDATIKKYEALGISVYTGGAYPQMYVKSTHDQVDIEGENYPAHKFLKCVNWREPVFQDPKYRGLKPIKDTSGNEEAAALIAKSEAMMRGGA